MSLWKKIAHPYLKWRYFQRAKNPYLYTYKGVSITIFPEVFSPKGTITTELFADYLMGQDWINKKVLELGAGSGLISFLLAKKGAIVTASDVSAAAIDGLNTNNTERGGLIEVIQSDLFQNLENRFETIILNPPFFDKNPTSEAEKAWFCGEEFDYFESLFSQFFKRNIYKETIIMVLSTNADMERILGIARENSLKIQTAAKLSKKGEKHLVFKITNK
jgi:release factor glutamine methyltransferase